MFALLLLSLFGCESDEDRHEREWKETMGALVSQYAARPLTGELQMDPKAVRGRKVLVDDAAPDLYASEKPEDWEARTVAEVGLVVVDHTVSDTTPSADYGDGAKGYGGTVTEAAFAHPEGKLVYTLTWHCNAPVDTLQEVNIGGGGGSHTFDNHCGGSRGSRLRVAGQLTDAIHADGSNTDAAGTDAYVALATGLLSHLADPVTKAPPRLEGRKALLMARSGDEPWKPWQTDVYLPAGRMAANAGEVGLVVFDATVWEARPSKHYACGVAGYAGTTELTAVAVPEGVVVARANPPCVLESEEKAAELADILEDTRCSEGPDAVRDWLVKLVGETKAPTP